MVRPPGGKPALAIRQQGIRKLRIFAEASTINVDQVYAVPITDDDLVNTLGMPEDMRGQCTASLSFKVAGTDPASFSVCLVAGFSAYAGTTNAIEVSAKVRFDINAVTGGQTLDMYFLVAIDAYGMAIEEPLYAYYNTATQACDMVATSTSEGHTADYISRSVVDQSEVTTTSLLRMDGQTSYVDVAWGDDLAGGVASLSDSYYWGEYCNGSGELLKRSNGGTNLWIPLWADDYINLRDLGYTQAPMSISQRSFWDGNARGAGLGALLVEVQENDDTWRVVGRSYDGGEGWVHETTADGGETWLPATSFSAEVVYKDSDTDWSGGDAIYYWESGRWEDPYWVNTLYQGYVVPMPVTRFGRDFFVRNEYPLKNIMPLSAGYAGTYKLIQEEGNTFEWTWTDLDGNPRTDSYTDYSYYLNKTQSVEDEPVIRFDADDGDIDLDAMIVAYDVYYWINQELSKVKGYFLTTTGAVPPYFTEPDTTVVDRVDASLQQALNDAYVLDTNAYRDKLDICRNDPVAGQL